MLFFERNSSPPEGLFIICHVQSFGLNASEKSQSLAIPHG